MQNEGVGNRWWESLPNLFSSFLWTNDGGQAKVREQGDGNEEAPSKMNELLKPNKSTLYTILSSNVKVEKQEPNVEIENDEEEEKEPEETEAEAKTGEANVSSLYKIISSQNLVLKKPEQLEEKLEEEEYQEIPETFDNQHFETENSLTIAENSLYYVEDDENERKTKSAEDLLNEQTIGTKKSTIEISLKTPSFVRTNRSQSIIETPTSPNDFFAIRKANSSDPKCEIGDLSKISFSFFNQEEEDRDSGSIYDVLEDSGRYLSMNDAASENPYSSPRNSVNASREMSPGYVGPEPVRQQDIELFYAASEVLQRRPPTPYGKRRRDTIRESEYEDLDLEDEELPEIPLHGPPSASDDVDDMEDYADVDMNDYCRHREENPKKPGPKKNVKLVKMKSKLKKTWKSMKSWINEEKEEGVKPQMVVEEGAVEGEPETEQVDAAGSKNSTMSAVSVASDAYVDMKAGVGAAAEGLEELLSTLTLRRRRKDGSVPPALLIRKSRHFTEGQQGFEELRRYIKQGGDFCKELCAILQERSDAETQYAKSLSKLSSKLLKTSKDAVGGVSEAWQRLGCEMEAEGETHRVLATGLTEEVVKPLRQMVEQQHRLRKGVEAMVDKTGKSLAEWRQVESKSKKQSFLCARENEKLQDAMLDVRNHRNSSSGSSLHLHLHHNNHKDRSDKDSAKLDVKRRKAEDAVKKADIEYYTVCVRSERARLEWETAVTRGSHVFQNVEQDRLTCLKNLATCYCRLLADVPPKLTLMCERLRDPVDSCEVQRDIQTVVSMKGTGSPTQEQLLPDFYAEHVTLAMNRERRRTALVKLLQLTRQDIERERRGKQGVENLRRAMQQTPNFGGEETQQNVEDKLHHMKSMLIYLEATRYKITSALSELDGRASTGEPPSPTGHPLASHIQVTRDRQGLQQSVLRVPSWVSEDAPDLSGREQGDGTSNQPDSDYDEFSSVGSEKDYQSSVYNMPVVTTLNSLPATDDTTDGTTVPAHTGHTGHTASHQGQCTALYEYTAKLYDELDLQIGDVITIHEKQPDGWWLGELHGHVGIFPATYVEEIK